MADRIILHCDLNNFFASVSLLYNPTLKDLPVAVCGDKENRHGIVLAKNEIAKSKNVYVFNAYKFMTENMRSTARPSNVSTDCGTRCSV